MGDRCYCWGYVRRADWPRFQELTEADESPHLVQRPGLVSFDVQDANYALHRELEKAAAGMLAFYAFNDRGDTYTSGVAVSAGDGVLLTADTDANGYVTITLTEHGELDLPALQEARKVCRAIQAVRILGEATP